MVTITLYEKDGAVTMALPQEYATRLERKEGSVIDVSVYGSVLMAKPKSHSLEQLLKVHAEIIDESDDNSDWVNAPAVGRELI